jgi:hypothetical protein
MYLLDIECVMYEIYFTIQKENVLIMSMYFSLYKTNNYKDRALCEKGR